MVSEKLAIDKKFPWKAPTPKFSLRTTLVVPFVLQIFAAVGLVGYLSFKSGQQSVNDVASQLRREVSNRIKQNLDNYLKTPYLIHQVNFDALELKQIDLQNLSILERHFWKQIHQFPDIGFIGYASDQGEMLGMERLDNGLIEINLMENSSPTNLGIYTTDLQGNRINRRKIIPNFINSKRPWYQKAVQSKKATWSDIFIYQGTPRPAISAVVPVYDRAGQIQGVLFNDFLLSLISDFLKTLKIGNSGQTFIIERSGMLVASSTEKPFFIKNPESNELEQIPQRLSAVDSRDPIVQATTKHLLSRFKNFNKISTEEPLDFAVNNHRYFAQVSPFKDRYGLDWLIVVVVPESDFMGQIESNTRKTIILSLVALIVAIVLGILSARWISRPIFRITQASESIASGNLDQHVNESHRIVEIKKLANSFNSMAGQLKESFETLEDKVEERTAELDRANQAISALNQRLKNENIRMSAELDILQQMQQLILPKPTELAAIEDLDIAGFMESASEVGGDYYDVLCTNGVVTICIGDVTGHGLESGILMVMTQAAVRTLQEMQESDPVRFLDTLNRTIYKNVQRMNSDKNMTLALLNYADSIISISGQHEETLVVRKGGQIQRIDTIDLGFPLGLEEDISKLISHVLVELGPGDGVVLYTDGIPEARNMHKKFYGIERLCEVVSQNWHLSAEQIKEATIDDLRRFIGEQKVFDDITLLVLKQQGNIVHNL
ncbi:SpoIIE family protein phosphatase [Microcoleus sp. Pol11C3]|uniref:SpoIIE family protein phosphatase n=1 Tax=Microcoleus sp. Pol11C3 TaxID=3055390 RepID=UPI002FD383C4